MSAAENRGTSMRTTWTGSVGSGRRSTASGPSPGVASPLTHRVVADGGGLREAARPAHRRGRRAEQQQEPADGEDGRDLLLALLRPDARPEPLVDALQLAGVLDRVGAA